MSVLIEADNLGRYFGAIKAVDGVSFQVKKGEVLGFLGPNGAGKSTTMKMLTCFLTPSFGKARVNGFDVVEQSRQVRAALGYLPENAPLYGEMEVTSFLRFVSEIRFSDRTAQKNAVERVMEMTELGDVAHQPIETLSKGFKRRVGLAQALIHDPQILVLDEPTDGLDPNQKHEVRKLILSMRAEKCIILSTHILEEVDEVCSRAVIIAKGKVVADNSPQELKKLSKHHGAVCLSLRQPLSGEQESRLRNIAGVQELQVGDGRSGNSRVTLFPAEGKQILAPVVHELEQGKIEYSDVRLEAGYLDEVFRQITQ